MFNRLRISVSFLFWDMHPVYYWKTSFFVESSSRYIENQQSHTTLVFGWDDASDIKVLKNVSINSYNGVSEYLYVF
jgi:hypothetical protein